MSAPPHVLFILESFPALVNTVPSQPYSLNICFQKLFDTFTAISADSTF